MGRPLRPVAAAIRGGGGGAACAVGILLLGETGDGVGTNLGALAAAVLGAGLTGQDLHLDRTAAIRWWPRRALHVLVGLAVVVVVLLLAWEALDTNFVSREFVLRDTVGAVGLVALTATVFGGYLAWTVPLVWFALSLFMTPAASVWYRISAWMVQPDDTVAAGWTAGALGAAGVIGYALFGNRR